MGTVCCGDRKPETQKKDGGAAPEGFPEPADGTAEDEEESQACPDAPEQIEQAEASNPEDTTAANPQEQQEEKKPQPGAADEAEAAGKDSKEQLPAPPVSEGQGGEAVATAVALDSAPTDVAAAVGPGTLVIVVGPPAAGKGTLCQKMTEKQGFIHVSTGDILRENVKNETELGIKAKDYMDKGSLVPSELIVGLVKDRLAQDDVKQKGCLLDGFPRTADQAQELTSAGFTVTKLILLEVSDDILVERGVGRRLDPETGTIYHLTTKPPPEDIKERLVHRSDDQEDMIRNRLKEYRDQIDGILPFFTDVTARVDGAGSPEEVWEQTQKHLS